MRLFHLTMTLLLIVLLSFGLSAKAKKEKKEPSTSKKESVNIVVDSKGFTKRYVERQVLYYESKVKEFQLEIQSLLKRTVEEKKRQISEKYNVVIGKESSKEVVARADAIVLFQQFIKKYPEKPFYTPSAMYRLAELYYENAAIEKETADQKRDQLIKDYEDGRITTEPESAPIDFSKTIALYQTIIDKFPQFSYTGAVYYMLGYCLAEQGETEKAVAIWKRIIEQGIATEYLAEVYLRVGNYYFDDDQLDEAFHYFSKGVKFKDSFFYDKILYKLAWTHYRLNHFEKAVDQFVTLIAFADEMKENGVDRGQELRKEAIQYIAISYADEEWGSVDKAIEKFSTIKGEKFEWGVFSQLGKYYFENGNYAQAELAYRYLLNGHPYSVDAPKVHEALIHLYYKSNQIEKATKETETFATRYDRDGRWAMRNRGESTAVKKASMTAQKFLLDTARYHHQSAQKLKTTDKVASDAEYKIAVKYYRDYLEKFPYTTDSYDISFDYADTLFFSGNIIHAVVVYERIRNDKNQTKHRDEAAYQVFYGFTQMWNEADESKIPSKQKRGTPFSLLEKKLIEASDLYLKYTKNAEDAPAVAYTVARMFFDHGDFEEAAKRDLKIINKYPASQPAIFAARDIINSYDEQKDWLNVAKWSKILTDRLEQKGKVSTAIAKEFKRYRAGALFKYADALAVDKKYRKSGEEYLRIVQENPYTKTADKALYNAALNFQRAAMYDSALKILERVYREYPYSDLAPNALFLVASNAEKSFNFKKAVAAYKDMFEKYPSHKQSKASLWNLSLLLERLQQYKKAAKYYQRFSEEYPDDKDSKQALFLAGTMYRKGKRWKMMISYFNSYVDEIRDDVQYEHLMYRALHTIAKTYEEKLHNNKKAKKYYQKMVDLYSARPSENNEITIYTAEAAFKLLEDEYNDYLKITFNTNDQKKLGGLVKKKQDAVKQLAMKYSAIEKYGAAEWIMAVMFRKGLLLENFANTFKTSKPPKREKGWDLDTYDEIILAYQDSIDVEVDKYEQQAMRKYELAIKVAGKLKAYNKWTDKCQERLTSLLPDNYNFGRPFDAIVSLDFEVGEPVALTLDREEQKEYVKQSLFESSKKNEEEETETEKEQEK